MLDLEMVDIKPNTVPGKPPKSYSKKKAIGLFICRESGCFELVRGINRKGDIYILLFPECMKQAKTDFHESFHSSGEFHWRMEGRKIYPLYGVKDLPAAFKFKFFRVEGSPCICLRKGRKLNLVEIEHIVEHLGRYLPQKINVREVSFQLNKRGFVRLTREDLHMLEKLFMP
jgi:hypothetical protein